MEGIIIVILAILVYFLPSLIASNRKHNNVNPIQALNIFLGWTALGWIAALIWALTDNVKPKS
jgi:hypothetical protein